MGISCLAVGGTPLANHGDYTDEPADSGATYAAVDLVPGIAVVANNPHAHASGAGWAHAVSMQQSGGAYLTAALAEVGLVAGDDSAFGSTGTAGSHFYPHAEAEFEVSDTQIDEYDYAWIEGDIVWNGFGEDNWTDPIMYSVATRGGISVGDTHLYFETRSDGITYVTGILMGLDGPHEYIEEPFEGPVTLPYKQQVGPGEEISTFSEFNSDWESGDAFIIAHQEVGNLSDEVGGSGYGYSTMKAYTGTPD